MEIRTITPADIPAILAMGGLMHDESEYRSLDYAPEKCAALCRSIMANADTQLGLVAVEGDEHFGMLGAYVTAAYFSDDLVSGDYLVYVRPEFRGTTAFVRMVKRYIEWAKERGAQLIFLRTSTGIESDATAALYQRLGFARVGGVFRREG